MVFYVVDLYPGCTVMAPGFCTANKFHPCESALGYQGSCLINRFSLVMILELEIVEKQ